MKYSVFTKPWREKSLDELGAFVAGLGFNGIELPVRDGYQVPPEEVARLPQAAQVLAKHGVSIDSVAGPTDEATIAACGEAGVRVIRVCEGMGDANYLEAEVALKARYDALLPLLEKHGVTIGVQNHFGRFVNSPMDLLHLIEDYDPAQIGAVLDVGHCGLAGAEPDYALDITWSHLCLVNFKNAYRYRTNGPEAEQAEWRVHWTSGRHGQADWPRYAEELLKRRYDGTICLTAEYSDHDSVERLITEDIAYCKTLFEVTP